MSEQLFSSLGRQAGQQLGQQAMSGSVGQSIAGSMNQVPLLTGNPTTIANPSAPGVTTTIPSQSGGIFGGAVTPQGIGQTVGGALGDFVGGSVGSRLDALKEAELGLGEPLPLPALPPAVPGRGIPPSIPDPTQLTVPMIPLTLADLLRRRG